MKLKLFLIFILVVAGGGAIFISLGGLTASAAATTYLTAAAVVGNVSDDVAATGATETTASYGLAFGAPAHLVSASSTPSSSGTWPVKSVAVAAGDKVTKGQKIAVADTASLQSQLLGAIASRRSAALQLVIAQENFDAATTVTAARQAHLALYQAQSQNVQATATQHDLEAQIAAATLIAPIDGVVTAVNVAAGPRRAVRGRDRHRRDDLQGHGRRGRDRHPQDQPRPARDGHGRRDRRRPSMAPSPPSPAAANAATSGRRVVCGDGHLTNPPPALRPGMTADVTITTASAANVLTVPAAALSGADGNYTVLVLTADRRARGATGRRSGSSPALSPRSRAA